MKIQKQSIENELLWLECQNNTREGFKSLVAQWEKPLFYYIRRMVNKEEDAWDILQEVWIHVAKGITKVREPKSLSAWLYKIARNRTLSHLEKVSRFRPKLFSEITNEIEVEDNIDCVSFSKYEVEGIHNALEKLKIEHREVLVLFFLESFSLNEIANITGSPVGTVKSRLYYAKRNLKKILNKEM